MSSLKESLLERRAAKAADASCAVASAPTATLVVSTWKGDTWVLPWSQLANARFGGPHGSERLELAFPSCHVVIHGRRLRSLLDDLAAFRLVSVRDFPPEYRPPAETTDAFIARIEVRPLMPMPPGGAEIREPSS